MLRQALAVLLFSSTALAVPVNQCENSLHDLEVRRGTCEYNFWAAACRVQTDFLAPGAKWSPNKGVRNYPHATLGPEYENAIYAVFSPEGTILMNVARSSRALPSGRAALDIPIKLQDLPNQLRVVVNKGIGTECFYVEDPSLHY